MNQHLTGRQVIGCCDIQTPPTFTYRAQSAWLINHVVSGVSAGPRAQVCPRVCALPQARSTADAHVDVWGRRSSYVGLHQRRRDPLAEARREADIETPAIVGSGAAER
jgi:hypothetical protein